MIDSTALAVLITAVVSTTFGITAIALLALIEWKDRKHIVVIFISAFLIIAALTWSTFFQVAKI